ncbi:hypothetical protein [Achromobacter anxifer]|uniref:hypothetical protein n=1 Tax=Achromobacter anxifer TaxID=1287737 RepID=UPI0023F70BE7|nr:hypothetical protein [Achromobacter anxifer]MDF8364714.1 hypothetical protein [Achromobacter anxifer]
MVEPTRRQFLAVVAAAGAATLASSPAGAAQTAAPAVHDTPGVFCVPVYGRSRFPAAPGEPLPRSCLVVVDARTGLARHIPSAVVNLHGLVEPTAANPKRQKLGIGHQSREILEVYSSEYGVVRAVQFPDISFRGHGLPHAGGALISAELISDPMKGGLLLYVDADGKEISRHATGGLRPHEIVDCGELYAVAHYGDRVPDRTKAAEPEPAGRLMFDLFEPSVTFLNKSDLAVVARHILPLEGAITHLSPQSDGTVLAMGMNAWAGVGHGFLHEYAARDHTTLLPLELASGIYERYVPIYRVSPEGGLMETIQALPHQMRRGQSFATAGSVAVGTYAASQTLFVRAPGVPDRWLNTLSMGVADPRGAAAVGDSGLVAISGNSDNIAVVDLKTGRINQLIGVPLGAHSHLYWQPS